MAPTRPDSAKAKSKKARRELRKAAGGASGGSPTPRLSPDAYIAQATASLERGDALAAAADAQKALDALESSNSERVGAALSLLGEIHVELGEPERACEFFLRAAQADPDGVLPEEVGGGADKFLWLAQLSEDGGADSAAWFDRGAGALRSQIRVLEERVNQKTGTSSQQQAVAEALETRRSKLAETLCAVAEVYMTDLSWEADAEARCEALVTEATLVAPQSPDAWQTLANVRVSQTRIDDARGALARSMDLWMDEADDEDEEDRVPPFPTRVALTRLLLEVEMEERGLEVARRLVREDDESVEVWYLGGYGLYLLGAKARAAGASKDKDEWRAQWTSSRRWLGRCLRLFREQAYEDERLGEHAAELLAEITKEVGEPPDGEDEDYGDDDGWEDVDAEDQDGDEDEDEEMA